MDYESELNEQIMNKNKQALLFLLLS